MTYRRPAQQAPMAVPMAVPVPVPVPVPMPVLAQVQVPSMAWVVALVVQQHPRASPTRAATGSATAPRLVVGVTEVVGLQCCTRGHTMCPPGLAWRLMRRAAEWRSLVGRLRRGHPLRRTALPSGTWIFATPSPFLTASMVQRRPHHQVSGLAWGRRIHRT